MSDFATICQSIYLTMFTKLHVIITFILTERRSMKIQMQPMGIYQTNCYIVTVDGKDIIIDPGVNSTEWIKKHTSNPVAILNTHGHFDHIWCNSEVKKLFNIPLYTPKEDVPMLSASDHMPELPPSTADIEVEGDCELDIDGIKVLYRHFPGHSPGCSTIEIGDAMFSGDFIFERSIGRVDFPYSSPSEMKKSLQRFLEIDYDKTVYPGHGNPTTIRAEQRNVPYWINAI
jgi:glyoxylase-like metal-dependent hydrolase (beta-lactamase superfamily II)